MPHEIDYLGAIRRESDRFAQCLALVQPVDAVPSCPDWTAADLLWHLTEVQLFWGFIVRDRLDNPGAAETLKPARPELYDDLQALARQATADLLDALVTTPQTTAVWTWADEQTVGFVLRRQAHEALIHRLDAELTVGDVTPFDPALSADGVDEALRIMFGSSPAWGTVSPDGVTGRVEATDTSQSWDVQFARFRGTSPNTGTTYDEDVLRVPDPDDDAPPAFIISGTGADLDRYLWGRGDLGTLATTGEASAIDRFAGIIASGVQ